MTDDEKQFLIDLFEKHELSFHNIVVILDLGATRMAMHALEIGDTVLEDMMADLDFDCMRYLTEHTEE